MVWGNAQKRNITSTAVNSTKGRQCAVLKRLVEKATHVAKEETILHMEELVVGNDRFWHFRHNKCVKCDGFQWYSGVKLGTQPKAESAAYFIRP